MSLIRKTIGEMGDYFVLQDSPVKLNQNESPYDIPLELKEKITEKLHKTRWNRYPPANASRLKEKLADYSGHPPEGIVTANGSNEIIQAILLAACDPGDRVMVVSPGFSIYTRLAGILGLKVLDIPLLEDFTFDVPSMMERSLLAKVIMFASPNNPTGTVLDVQEIERIAASFQGLLVVDEAYFEFHEQNTQKLIEKYHNIIVIRTFSKAFGMAGLRLGYLLASPEIAGEVEKTKLPFSVGIFQQAGAEVVLEQGDIIQEVVDRIKNERDLVFAELEDISSIEPVPSSANFILFRINGRPAVDVFEQLKAKGVLVRFFGIPRLENMLRVTIGTSEENRAFVKNLIKVMEG